MKGTIDGPAWSFQTVSSEGGGGDGVFMLTAIMTKVVT